jgi:hypothetical protein
MPTITSQRTGPAARRQRRRARRRLKVLSTGFPHRQRNHRRSIPKRQLREQSADVDDCFEDCRWLGYHLDPDVHVGSLIAQGENSFYTSLRSELITRPGNPFSALDSDYSTHSTPDPIPTPYQDHTIRTPNPFLAELEWQVARKSYPKLEDIEGQIFTQPEEKEEGLRRFPMFWWHSHGQVDDPEPNRASISKTPPSTARTTIPPSVQTTSIPTTPPSRANVKLPGSYPQDDIPTPTSRPSKKRKLNDSAPPSFAAAYRVPSPLLYHKPNRDVPPETNDEANTCICFGPSCDDAREEQHRMSGSRSLESWDHQPVAILEAEATRPLLQKEYRFVAAALPNMGSATPYSPIEQAVFCSDPDFYTNTCPYQSPRKSPLYSKATTGSSTPSTGASLSSLAKAKNFTSRIYAAEDLRLTDTPLPATLTSLPVVAIPEGLQQPRSVFPSHELVFSHLPSSAVCRDRSLDRYFERTMNFWAQKKTIVEQSRIESRSLDNDTVDYVQEKPSKFQDLWDAYERAVLGPKVPTKPLSVLSIPLCPRPDLNALPIVRLPSPPKGSDLFPAPANPDRTANPVRSGPIDIKLPKEINIPSWSFSPCTALISARLYERQYLGLMIHNKNDKSIAEQPLLPTSNAILEQIKEPQSHGKIQHAVDWLTEDLDLENMFDDGDDDELETKGTYLPWLQAGWEGHLFYPEVTASASPLPPSSPSEDVELAQEEQTDSDSWGGTQVNEDTEDMWWDWDDNVSGWSEPSEDEFWDFDA